MFASCCIPQRMARLDFQVQILLFLFQVKTGCKGETVSAHKEEDVALMCLDSNVTELNSPRAKCMKYPTDAHSEKVIFDWPKKSGDDKRVTLKANGKGQFCLFFKTLQKSEAGMYNCQIWEGWDIVQVKNISLKIKDCTALLAVKAAPQTPVKLNCQVNMTSGIQKPVQIKWEMVKGNNPVRVNSSRVEMNDTILAFQSVRTSDSGWYRCTVGQTQQCYEINLLVTESIYVATTVPVTAFPTTQQVLTVTETVQISRKEPSSETSVPVVALVVIGILIILASTGFFIYRRHKTQRETPQQLRQPAGCLLDSLDLYENLTLPHLQDSGNRVNSLYQITEESVCTFRY